MPKHFFELVVIGLGIFFSAFFGVVVLPPLLESGDLTAAFAAGFVNPYASGYSTDAIVCALILASWVAYEWRAHGIRFGWIAVLLSIAPGVAAALAYYLILRSRQLWIPKEGEPNEVCRDQLN